MNGRRAYWALSWGVLAVLLVCGGWLLSVNRRLSHWKTVLLQSHKEMSDNQTVESASLETPTDNAVDMKRDSQRLADEMASMEYEEDENLNVVWEAYYDETGAQTNCEEGYASVEREFDAEGRMISERYLDRFNKLTNNAEGIASWNGYYDQDGELIVTNRYDKDLKALPIPEEGGQNHE